MKKNLLFKYQKVVRKKLQNGKKLCYMYVFPNAQAKASFNLRVKSPAILFYPFLLSSVTVCSNSDAFSEVTTGYVKASVNFCWFL